MSPPDDDNPYCDLVEKIQAGIDYQKSCELLHRKAYPKVMAFFTRRGFSGDKAKDLTQDVFVGVFKDIGQLEKPSAFGRWLFTIADSVYKNELRRKYALKREGEEESWEQIMEVNPARLVGLQEIGSSRQRDALGEIVEQEKREAVRKVIAGMPPQMRFCCYLRYLQGKKYREIAVIMKISIGTVKAHLSQAKQRLQGEVGLDLEPELSD